MGLDVNAAIASVNASVNALSSAQIIRLWEIGQRQHPVDRALTSLQVACPQVGWDTLAMLSIGQRDAYLLRLRERTFGTQMDSLATCPQCQEQLEFTLSTTDLIPANSPPPLSSTYDFHINDLYIQFRLPTSQDLAAVLPVKDSSVARQQLVRHCLLQVEKQGQAVAPEAWVEAVSEEAIAQLNQQILEVDPQSEILLNLSCPACQHDWQVLFDIVAFFWAELAAKAQRLLLEVHHLARFYGWREADILAMSAIRRQYYLEQVS